MGFSGKLRRLVFGFFGDEFFDGIAHPAALAMLGMSDVPYDSLLFGRIFGHLMLFVPLCVDFIHTFFKLRKLFAYSRELEIKEDWEELRGLLLWLVLVILRRLLFANNPQRTRVLFNIFEFFNDLIDFPIPQHECTKNYE